MHVVTAIFGGSVPACGSGRNFMQTGGTLTDCSLGTNLSTKSNTLGASSIKQI